LFAPSTYRALRDHSTFEVFRGIFPDGTPSDTPEQRVNASLHFELKTFLHGLLIVEDKVSMAHSLEVRVPFLDNDLVDLACRLPASYKLRDLAPSRVAVDENEPGKRLRYNSQTQDGKKILRQACSRLVPPAVTERVKQGFSAPDASWFRGESIDYVNGLLCDRGALIYEYLNPEYVTHRLREHSAGRHNDRLFIWSALSFEWWLRKFFN
jgi:asparagine synthase (glutamine-hydrolysing)